MVHPPTGVRLVMEAVAIMMGATPKDVAGPVVGQKTRSYWESAKAMAKDMKFLQSILNYDRDNISASVVDKITPYLANPDFDPARIQRTSIAATSLCQWVRAMMCYHEVLKVVNPKRRAVEEAEHTLRDLRANLREKKEKLLSIEEDIAKQLQHYSKVIERKEALTAQVAKCSEQLDRAQRILRGLGGEMMRWREASSTLAAAAKITYLGPFNPFYRQMAITRFKQILLTYFIPHTQHNNDEGDDEHKTEQETEQEEARWHRHHLPHDHTSRENAWMVFRSVPFPVMIDPQGQANRWLKSLLKETKLIIVKPEDADLPRKLENAIQFGNPLLLEDVSASSISPLIISLLASTCAHHIAHLAEATLSQPSVEKKFVRVGDTQLVYEEGFRLYITTRDPNPRFGPDITARATLIDFTLTPEALEEQLLTIGIAHIHPDLEAQREKLVEQAYAQMQRLTEVEDAMLDGLSRASTQRLLDDETLISSLSQAKLTATNMQLQLAETTNTQRKINQLRSTYIPLASRGVLLFFMLSDLHKLDQMYRYSLSEFTRTFIQSIAERLALFLSDKADEKTKKKSSDIPIDDLIYHFTFKIFEIVSRSLLENHKSLFTVALCAKILIVRGDLEPAHWHFLLTGGTSDSKYTTIPPPVWISKRAWQELVSLASLPGFSSYNIVESVTKNPSLWQKYLQAPEIELLDPPLVANSPRSLPIFYKLLVLRCLKPEKVMPAFRYIINAVLGPEFELPTLSPYEQLQKAYEDSISTTPILLYTSASASGDPISEITRLSEKKPSRRLFALSMGQGQGPIAEKIILEAIDTGRWVLLQNCHLAITWLPTLDRLVASIRPDRVHSDFRLWITCAPTEAEVPTTLLQNSVKIARVAPKGVRPNLLRASEALSMVHHPKYFKDSGTVSSNIASEVAQSKSHRRLLFGLAFFHAVIVARKHYGTSGWSIPYEFSDADLTISVRQMRYLLDTYDEIPYVAIANLIGGVNYGGRVTDNWDRRALLCILNDFCSERVINEAYKIIPQSATYFIPSLEKLEEYQSYIKTLPPTDPPSLFGLHANTATTCAQNELFAMFDATLRLSRAGNTNYIFNLLCLTCLCYRLSMQNIARDLQNRIPRPSAPSYAPSALFSIVASAPHLAVMQQEHTKYARLFTKVHTHLADLLAALDGKATITPELDEVAYALHGNRVPSDWLYARTSRSQPSHSAHAGPTLRSWVDDVIAHSNYVAECKSGSGVLPNHTLWLGALYQPQAFLTAVAQIYARKRRIPADSVFLHAKVLQADADSPVQKPPDDGCYVRGLYLEGAAWDVENGKLIEALPGVLCTPMPLVWLYPVVNRPLPSPLAALPPPPSLNKSPSVSMLSRTPSSATLSLTRSPSNSNPGLSKSPSVGLVKALSSMSLAHSHSTSSSLSSSLQIPQTPPPQNYVYLCPIYKTLARGGSGEGSVVLSMELNSELPPDHWVKRGTCISCALRY